MEEDGNRQDPDLMEGYLHSIEPRSVGARPGICCCGQLILRVFLPVVSELECDGEVFVFGAEVLDYLL
jgi:hypothetical protein